jgi:hypothetical protein
VNVHSNPLRTERLTVLVSREEKQRLAALAKERRVSIGELVRSTVSSAVDARPSVSVPTAEQALALEQAAALAIASLRKADSALTRAETELAKTRAYFDSKPGEVRDAHTSPKALLARALAKTTR